MCTYLVQRNATYYFRRVIPAELRPAFNGKREFMGNPPRALQSASNTPA